MLLAAASEVHEVVPIGLTDFLIIGTCLASWFFGIAYTSRMPWWKYQMGINLFVLRFGIGLILTPFTLHYFFSLNVTSPFYQWFSTIIFALVGLAVCHTSYMLLIQPGAEKQKKAKPPAPDSVKGFWQQLRRDRSLDGEPGSGGG